MRYIMRLFPCIDVCHHRKCFHFFPSKAEDEDFEQRLKILEKRAC